VLTEWSVYVDANNGALLHFASLMIMAKQSVMSRVTSDGQKLTRRC